MWVFTISIFVRNFDKTYDHLGNKDSNNKSLFFYNI